MAKVINPLMSTEARGRIGGIIANTWRGISTMKAFCSPSQPRSARQLQLRAWNAYLMRKWQSLTAPNRVNWNEYAADHPDIDWTGNPKRLTGLNWYLRCNIRILDAGGTIIADPPSVPAPDPITGLAVTYATGSLSVAYTTSSPATKFVDIRRVGPISAGVAAKIERARHIEYKAISTSPATESGLRPGQFTVFVRVLDSLTGLASPDLSSVGTVT